MTAGISTSHGNINIGTNVSTRARGKKSMYAPNTPDIAPLAPISLFSSQFLHGGWLHIIRNLWILYVFGDNVEDRMGHLQYLVFYLITGIVGGLLQVVTQPFSITPMIGASGAVQ